MSPAKIKLNATTGGGSVSLEAPSSTTNDANIEFKLPVADGVGSLVSDGSGNLSIGGGGGGSQTTKDVTLASGASTTNAKLVNLNALGQVGTLPQMSTVGTFVTDSNYHPEPGNSDGGFTVGSSDTTSPDHHGYLYPDATLVHRHTSSSVQSNAQTAGVRYSKTGSAYRVRFSSVLTSNVATMTIVGEVLNADGTVTASGTTQTISTTSDSYNTRHECTVQQWTDNYWVGVVRSVRDNVGSSSRYHRMSLQMFTVNPSTGAITLLGTKHDEAFNNKRGNFYDDENSGVTEVQMRWNCAAIRMGRMSTRGIQMIFFKFTTSGATQIGAWTHNQNNNTSANNEIGGLNHVYAVERCRSVSGGTDKSIGLNTEAFEVYDFTGSYSENLLQSSSSYETDYGSEGFNIFVNATHFLRSYKDVNGNRHIKLFSTDGAGGFSQLTDYIYETATGNKFGPITRAVVKSATEIVVYFDNGTVGLKSLSSIELDGSYNVVGIKELIKVSGLRGVPAHRTGDAYHIFNATQTAPFTVNSYKNSVPINFHGVAQQTATSGTATICFAGIATGFSSLTVGSKYYVDQLLNGDITTSDFSGRVIGTAISPTELLVGDVR